MSTSPEFPASNVIPLFREDSEFNAGTEARGDTKSQYDNMTKTEILTLAMSKLAKNEPIPPTLDNIITTIARSSAQRPDCMLTYDEAVAALRTDDAVFDFACTLTDMFEPQVDSRVSCSQAERLGDITHLWLLCSQCDEYSDDMSALFQGLAKQYFATQRLQAVVL